MRRKKPTHLRSPEALGERQPCSRFASNHASTLFWGQSAPYGPAASWRPSPGVRLRDGELPLRGALAAALTAQFWRRPPAQASRFSKWAEFPPPWNSPPPYPRRLPGALLLLLLGRLGSPLLGGPRSQSREGDPGVSERGARCQHLRASFVLPFPSRRPQPSTLHPPKTQEQPQAQVGCFSCE